jgi:hypothetical protein
MTAPEVLQTPAESAGDPDGHAFSDIPDFKIHNPACVDGQLGGGVVIIPPYPICTFFDPSGLADTLSPFAIADPTLDV